MECVALLEARHEHRNPSRVQYFRLPRLQWIESPRPLKGTEGRRRLHGEFAREKPIPLIYGGLARSRRSSSCPRDLVSGSQSRSISTSWYPLVLRLVERIFAPSHGRLGSPLELASPGGCHLRHLDKLTLGNPCEEGPERARRTIQNWSRSSRGRVPRLTVQKEALPTREPRLPRSACWSVVGACPIPKPSTSAPKPGRWIRLASRCPALLRLFRRCKESEVIRSYCTQRRPIRKHTHLRSRSKPCKHCIGMKLAFEGKVHLLLESRQEHSQPNLQPPNGVCLGGDPPLMTLAPRPEQLG